MGLMKEPAVAYTSYTTHLNRSSRIWLKRAAFYHIYNVSLTVI